MAALTPLLCLGLCDVLACRLQVVVNQLMRASLESMHLGDGIPAHQVVVPDTSADSSGVSSDEDSSADNNVPGKGAGTEVSCMQGLAYVCW
jgi:hypothetical protein